MTATTMSYKATNDSGQRDRSVQILAKSLIRDLTAQGYDTNDIVNLATQLIDQVTVRIGTTTARR